MLLGRGVGVKFAFFTSVDVEEHADCERIGKLNQGIVLELCFDWGPVGEDNRLAVTNSVASDTADEADSF